jgi:hypothetical protein
MGDAVKAMVLIGIGFAIGALVFGFSRMVVLQEGFSQGRSNALSRPVTLKGPEPCNISIPLSALVDLVNTGILDWHEACVAATGGKDE